jgi:hypothetical protein
MRIRTVWDWRLRLYPIIVIPLMVYFVAAQDTALSNGEEAVAGRGKGKPAITDSQNGAPASATPLSGFYRGRAVTCERRPEITFCWQMTGERR